MLPILQDQHKQMDTIQNNTALSPQQRHQQMRAAMMDTHQKLEALMTDTQKQQFEQAMQQRRDRMRNGWHGAGGRRRGHASTSRTDKMVLHRRRNKYAECGCSTTGQRTPHSLPLFFCRRNIDPGTLWKNESAPAVGTF